MAHSRKPIAQEQPQDAVAGLLTSCAEVNDGLDVREAPLGSHPGSRVLGEYEHGRLPF